jgi:hypothetical protein
MQEAPVDFSEAKLRQLDAASTYRVYGHEIAFEGGATGEGATARRRWRLISPCLCVQDSPASPCPRITNELRWWLRGEAVIDEGNAARKDHDGQELQFFDVLVDSNIMVESLRPVSAGALKRLGANLSPEELRGLMSGSGPAGGVSASIVDVILSAAKEVLNEVLGGALDPVFAPIDLQSFVKGGHPSPG